MMMSDDDHRTKGVQRFEVFTGAGRRREWPAAVKASIVAETCSGRETVCAVARRHGLAPSQLFAWRRVLLQSGRLELPAGAADGVAFVPAIVSPPLSPEPAGHGLGRAAVELQINGTLVKIAHDAGVQVITAVIEALRASR